MPKKQNNDSEQDFCEHLSRIFVCGIVPRDLRVELLSAIIGYDIESREGVEGRNLRKRNSKITQNSSGKTGSLTNWVDRS